MSDTEFDLKLKELKQMENEINFSLASSPTHKVGYKVLQDKKKVVHGHPMLSLDKCHTAEEVLKFANNRKIFAMVKADGLSLSLRYENGELVSAETRGDGEVGQDCFEHVKQFKNVPLKINKEGVYVIDGEAIIYMEDFNSINDGTFKNPRNLAAGTLSVLETKIVKERKLSFVAWDVIEGSCTDNLVDSLLEATGLGFTVIPYDFLCVGDMNVAMIDHINNNIMKSAETLGIPCDGVVYKFVSRKYGESLGRTEHHFNCGIAWKPEIETKDTILRNLEWTMGKTGQLTPVAVFDPVELNGTTVERASLHNISITRDILHKPFVGQKIKVYKANMIIPQVFSGEESDEADFISIPKVCSVCGGKTNIVVSNGTKNLVCENPLCSGKLLGRLSHFVSRDCMNIDGMSEATLEFLIDMGWIKRFSDIYKLPKNTEVIRRWKAQEGFGAKSVDNLITAINKSKDTTLNRVIDAISIPNIGTHAARDISDFCGGEVEKFLERCKHPLSFSVIPGIGDKTVQSIKEWLDTEYVEFLNLVSCLNIQAKSTEKSNKVAGKNFVITGSLVKFKNRKEAENAILNAGGKLVGSVSKNTDFLVNNDKESTSSKNKKAKELGVPIISEEELIKMIE